MFADTEHHPFLLLKLNFHRREIPPCMRPVAERARFGPAASAPIARAWSDLQHTETALRDDDLVCHASSRLSLVPLVSSTELSDNGGVAPVLR